MEALVDYIKPELLITAIALYFMGIALKEAQAVKDKYIPLILGVQGSLYAEFMFLLPVPVKCTGYCNGSIYIHDTGSPGGGAFYM